MFTRMIIGAEHRHSDTLADMTTPAHLTIKDARKLFLKQQGLLHSHAFGRGKQAVKRSIDQLTYVQIDTISVVNRAHEHVLATRVNRASPNHLDALVRERQVFEYWDHAAAFLPMEDYRFTLPVKHGWRTTREHDRKIARQIMKRIRDEGPLSSRDFEDTRQRTGNGWWDWKPAKKGLEHLFLAGELMVSHREGFQKVYDLPERVLPSHIKTTPPDVDAWCEFLVRRRVNALGVATERDIGYAKSTIRRLAKIGIAQPLKEAIAKLCESGELIPLQVGKIQNDLYYSTPDILGQLPLKATRGRVRLLSPFDNLIINRERTRALFDFDYQLECYVPSHKRQYGYFVLPLLYGDELIGRLDAKADRKTGTLHIKKLFLEPKQQVNDRLVQQLTAGIRHFAEDHSSHHIELQHCSDSSLKRQLEKTL